MANKSSILVVDDDSAHRMMLKTLISGWGYEVFEADDGSAAIENIRSRAYDLVLMDVRMIKVSGTEALVKIKEFNPAVPVILMTAYSSVEKAVTALKNGAHDYLTKPLDFEKLKITIKRTVEHFRLKEENKLLKENIRDGFDFKNIIGKSPKIIKLLETVSQVAPSDATVLIRGESGTGKELIAAAIHYNSSRKNGPFVKINCAAITETILESELFGHEKGAFTGAERRKEGKFVQADKGTLFLDEVSEMPRAMQVKLLRVIQERELVRVGGEDIIKVDVRLIAASNKDLEEMIKKGEFREDLFYRLNVIFLNIPPLREKREDIPLLAQSFIERFSKQNGKKTLKFTPEAIDCLIRSSWQGNVRELMNAVERGVVLARTDYVTEKDLAFISDNQKEEDIPFQEIGSLEDVEKDIVLKTLEQVNHNKSEASRRLGITRKTLHKKLQKYRQFFKE